MRASKAATTPKEWYADLSLWQEALIFACGLCVLLGATVADAWRDYRHS